MTEKPAWAAGGTERGGTTKGCAAATVAWAGADARVAASAVKLRTLPPRATRPTLLVLVACFWRRPRAPVGKKKKSERDRDREREKQISAREERERGKQNDGPRGRHAHEGSGSTHRLPTHLP